MNWFTFLVAAFAAWEIVEVWRHGSIFASRRARVELWEGWGWDFVRDLLMCPFCLSVWVGGFTTGWLIYCGDWHLLTWPLYALAVARCSNVFNDVTHPMCRTPSAVLDLEIPQTKENESYE